MRSINVWCFAAERQGRGPMGRIVTKVKPVLAWPVEFDQPLMSGGALTKDLDVLLQLKPVGWAALGPINESDLENDVGAKSQFIAVFIGICGRVMRAIDFKVPSIV